MSRAYVPLALFSLYRQKIFSESFSSMELRKMIKIAIVMHLIDLSGHAMMRYISREVVDKYVGLNELQFASRRRSNIDDYLI